MSSERRNSSPPSRDRLLRERGFSVVETLSALAMMGIIASTLALGLVGQAVRNKHTQQVTAAIVAAQQVLDEMRAVQLSEIDPGNDNTETFEDIEVSGLSFDVEATFCSDPSLCSGNSMKQVTLDVKLNGETKYVVETVFSAFD